MRLFKFRALVVVDLPEAATASRVYRSGTRELMVHASHIRTPARDRFFAAMMTWDEQRDLRPGDRAVVTITVTDDEAPAYLDAGQPFTLWGAGSGHGIVTRQVFTDGSPS